MATSRYCNILYDIWVAVTSRTWMIGPDQIISDQTELVHWSEILAQSSFNFIKFQLLVSNFEGLRSSLYSVVWKMNFARSKTSENTVYFGCLIYRKYQTFWTRPMYSYTKYGSKNERNIMLHNPKSFLTLIRPKPDQRSKFSEFQKDVHWH